MARYNISSHTGSLLPPQMPPPDPDDPLAFAGPDNRSICGGLSRAQPHTMHQSFLTWQEIEKRLVGNAGWCGFCGRCALGGPHSRNRMSMHLAFPETPPPATLTNPLISNIMLLGDKARCCNACFLSPASREHMASRHPCLSHSQLCDQLNSAALPPGAALALSPIKTGTRIVLCVNGFTHVVSNEPPSLVGGPLIAWDPRETEIA